MLQILQLQFLNIYQPSDWTTATQGLKVDYDLGAYPLQVKTYDESATSEQTLFFYTADDTRVGYIYLHMNPFTATKREYYLEICPNWSEFTTPDPVVDSSGQLIWTFTRTATSLKITCNGVVQLDLVFSDFSSDCGRQWDNKDVAKIQFGDAAAKTFREEPTGEIHILINYALLTFR